jgi:Mce-associated membrane protein
VKERTDVASRRRDRGETAREQRRSDGWAVGALALLSAIVVALAATGIVLLTMRHGLHGQQAARESALAAARQQALNLVSLDARTIDRDYDRMLAGTTDPLRADLRQNRSAAKDALAKSKGTSTGTVTDAGLVELSGDKAGAVVIVDAVQTNTVTKTSLSHRFRFQLDLTNQGGTWLVGNLESVDICGSGSATEPGCAASQQPAGNGTPKPTPTAKR